MSDAYFDKGSSIQRCDFDERWLQPGGIVPIDMHTTSALLGEVKRLRALPSASVEQKPTAGAYAWIREAVEELKEGQRWYQSQRVEDLLAGVPVPQEDLGFGSPADIAAALIIESGKWKYRTDSQSLMEAGRLMERAADLISRLSRGAPRSTVVAKTDVLGDAEGLWQNMVLASVGPGNEKCEATTISKTAFIDAICLYEMAQVARRSIPNAVAKPICYGIVNAEGKLHWSENCIFAHEGDATDEWFHLNRDDPEAGWKIVPMYLHAALSHEKGKP